MTEERQSRWANPVFIARAKRAIRLDYLLSQDENRWARVWMALNPRLRLQMRYAPEKIMKRTGISSAHLRKFFDYRHSEEGKIKEASLSHLEVIADVCEVDREWLIYGGIEGGSRSRFCFPLWLKQYIMPSILLVRDMCLMHICARIIDRHVLPSIIGVVGGDLVDGIAPAANQYELFTPNYRKMSDIYHYSDLFFVKSKSVLSANCEEFQEYIAGSAKRMAAVAQADGSLHALLSRGIWATIFERFVIDVIAAWQKFFLWSSRDITDLTGDTRMKILWSVARKMHKEHNESIKSLLAQDCSFEGRIDMFELNRPSLLHAFRARYQNYSKK